MILLFVCVILHELGHSLVARRFGVPVREIVLLPLGGVAQMTKNPDKPLHELLIAAAGPLVNVIIAGILAVPLGARLGPLLLTNQGLLPAKLGNTATLDTGLVWLFTANATLVLFNLIPAFPLDGGRMLRALLAMVMGLPRATRAAVAIGQLIAVILGVYAVLNGHFILALVAVFIFFGAGAENSEAQAKTVLDTLRVGDAYNKHALTLAVGDRVSRVVDYILTSYQPDFAVIQGRSLIGIATRQDVLKALATHPDDTLVTEIMAREFLKVEAAQSLDGVRQAMQSSGARVAAGQNGPTYLGLISIEDIAEAFTIQTFVQRQKQSRPAQAGV